LTWAAYSGHKEIAELLLANGARLIGFEAYELGSIWGDEPKRSISPAQE
jgi:ankyrin repeat protein